MTCADHGRTALGEAELAAYGGTDAERQRSIDDLAARAGAVVGGPWWRSAGGPAVTVGAARASARSSRARDERGRIDVGLAQGQRDLATLAHELSHALAGVEHGHDGRFRAALVDLATVLMGAPTGARLAESMRDLGLAPSPRPWPPPMRIEGEGFRMVGA